MKVAVVGSRGYDFEIPEECIPKNTTLIISGGARGIDKKSREYAKKHHILIYEILPEYNIYGRAAPLRRNDIVINCADIVVAFWDGKSHGTKYVIEKCKEIKKPIAVYTLDDIKKIQKEQR